VERYELPQGVRGGAPDEITKSNFTVRVRYSGRERTVAPSLLTVISMKHNTNATSKLHSRCTSLRCDPASLPWPRHHDSLASALILQGLGLGLATRVLSRVTFLLFSSDADPSSGLDVFDNNSHTVDHGVTLGSMVTCLLTVELSVRMDR